MSDETDEEYGPEETTRRRDAVLKIMVNTPPQPRPSNRQADKNRKSTGADRAQRASDRQQKS
jgi:hypothetical protein